MHSFVSNTGMAHKNLNERLLALKENANFQSDQHHVRDGVTLSVFVRHEGFDAQGRSLPDDGSCFPGAKEKKQFE